MPTATTDYNVLMLGPRGSGKTTMLASLWKQLDHLLDPAIGTIQATFDTSNYFAEAFNGLKQMYRSRDLTVSAGIPGTDNEEFRQLSLHLRTQGHANPHLRLNFLDYPGGILTHGRTFSTETQETFKGHLHHADFCLVVVDTPALMEQGGRFHELRNCPAYVDTLFRARLRDGNRGPLPVLFIAIRCEKYVQAGQAALVRQRIQEDYSDLMESLEQQKCVTEICLVETLGTIVFTEFAVRTTAEGYELPQYQWRKLHPEAQPEPRNTGLPMQLILQAAMVRSLQQRRQGYDGVNWLRDLLDRDADLKRLISHIHEVITRELSTQPTHPAASAVEVAA